MKSANVPWPDCACAGKCAVGRCGQPECVSNHIVIDLTDTDSDSQPHSGHHSTGVSAVPHPSTLSSPLPGVRREAGGVHVDEEVCTSPQADTHTSSSAAYRQPSATVTDSVLVASSVVVRAVEAVETRAHHVSGAGGDTKRTSTRVSRSTGPRLPSQVLTFLHALPHTPRPLPVIADGRCSVASILLARGVIPDAHSTEDDKRVIDAERRRLGRSMQDKWTEREWVRQVPVDLVPVPEGPMLLVTECVDRITSTSSF